MTFEPSATEGTEGLEEDAAGAPPRTRRRLATLASRSLSFLLKASLISLSPSFFAVGTKDLVATPPLFKLFFHACLAKYRRSFLSIIFRPCVPGSPSGSMSLRNSRNSSAERMEEVMISTVFVPGSPAGTWLVQEYPEIAVFMRTGGQFGVSSNHLFLDFL